MSNRKRRWFVVSVLSAERDDGAACHSLASVPARNRDEAIGIYTSECLRERPSFLIMSVQCVPCPRGDPRPSQPVPKV